MYSELRQIKCVIIHDRVSKHMLDDDKAWEYSRETKHNVNAQSVYFCLIPSSNW